jgi:hypothetical protein
MYSRCNVGLKFLLIYKLWLLEFRLNSYPWREHKAATLQGMLQVLDSREAYNIGSRRRVCQPHALLRNIIFLLLVLTSFASWVNRRAQCCPKDEINKWKNERISVIWNDLRYKINKIQYLLHISRTSCPHCDSLPKTVDSIYSIVTWSDWSEYELCCMGRRLWDAKYSEGGAVCRSGRKLDAYRSRESQSHADCYKETNWWRFLHCSWGNSGDIEQELGLPYPGSPENSTTVTCIHTATRWRHDFLQTIVLQGCSFTKFFSTNVQWMGSFGQIYGDRRRMFCWRRKVTQSYLMIAEDSWQCLKQLWRRSSSTCRGMLDTVHWSHSCLLRSGRAPFRTQIAIMKRPCCVHLVACEAWWRCVSRKLNVTGHVLSCAFVFCITRNHTVENLCANLVRLRIDN